MLNHFTINGAALNADLLDNTIRSLVNSYGRAYITVKPRVLGYLKVNATGRAKVTGTRGSVRSPGYAYTPLSVNARAQIVHKPKVLVHHALTSVARATITLRGMAIANTVRVPVTVNARAQLVLRSKVLARVPVAAVARAQMVVKDRVLRRAPVQAQGRAQVVVNTNVYRLGVYDRPATQECTYVVPFSCNKFTVGYNMKLATIHKQPREVRDYDINFGDSEWGFPEGDVISSVQITANIAGINLTFAYTGRIVKIWAAAGVDKVTYKVTVLATTNNGRTQEVELIFKVKDE